MSDVAANGYYREDLHIGLSESYSRTIREEDIVAFAEISGDHNPLHLDEAFAAGTRFKGRIAHGMLTASFISTVLGTRLPGAGVVYLSQSLNFKAPVRIGDTATATVTVKELVPGQKRVRFDTIVRVGDTVVIDGEAVAYVPSRG